ncbi:glycosyltransferase family 4 protein [Marivita hallyeonensis]|uniref:Glycosyltransferase involved in cell wall bisynthesis n=1 Tax=Marivita hallyeonensis TaxID=996342 RepID=A0A1M5Y4R1_9RHOB|nr:glycosyltransferase family 1 protein [Marivita hallyeonensis]SHI06794.1 Glycosyltransferase involved in cell wall bisynthesis [Marivita hallyeonensis]
MTQTFFDVSDIVTYIREHASVSGIQRAAVKIIAEAVRMRGRDVFLSFYHPVKKSYVACPAEDLLTTLETFDAPGLARAFGVRMRRPDIPEIFLQRYTGQPVKQAVHIARMRLAGARGQSRYFDRRGLDFRRWQHLYGRRSAAAAVTVQPFEKVAQPGDALCGLGAIWGRGKVLSAFRQAAERNVRVYMLVHDLIPMKLPGMADPRAARSYHDWLVGSAEYVSGYLANSEATAADLRAFLDQQGLAGTVHVTPLAQAGVHVADRPAPALDPLVHEAATLPFVLCVGTIEPRKNLWRLAQVWARLSQRTDIELPRLVLAGKRGWLTGGFLSILERTGGLGGWVIWLDAPGDHELDHLYRTCLFTATVSLYEGWGLPIGEGLSYGKTGVVSQAASMPEVGGELVAYCDPASMQSIEAAVLRLLDPEHRSVLQARIAEADLRSWEDVGRDVLAVLAD